MNNKKSNRQLIIKFSLIGKHARNTTHMQHIISSEHRQTYLCNRALIENRSLNNTSAAKTTNNNMIGGSEKNSARFPERSESMNFKKMTISESLVSKSTTG